MSQNEKTKIFLRQNLFSSHQKANLLEDIEKSQVVLSKPSHIIQLLHQGEQFSAQPDLKRRMAT